MNISITGIDLPQESKDNNRQRVKAFMRDLQSKHLERLGRWFTEFSRVWIPPSKPVVGRKRILALFRAIFRMYSDLNWEVEKVYCINGSTAIFVSKSWGVLRPEKTYQNAILTLIQFNCTGKIDYLSDYVKDARYK